MKNYKEDGRLIEKINNAISKYDPSIFDNEDLLQEIYLYALEHKSYIRYTNYIIDNILIKVKNKYEKDENEYKSLYFDIDNVIVEYDRIFDNNELLYYFNKIFSTLRPRYVEALSMYYGIGQPSQRLDMISKHIGFTETYIRFIIEKGLRIIRHPSRNKYIIDYYN